MAVEISAIVCTRNRAGFLKKCLHGLLQQSLEPDRYEVIVVDNGSTDTTQEVLKGFSGNPLIKGIFEPVPGLSRARNRGLEEARAPFVGYIDDDAVPGEKWLESALQTFTNCRPQPDWVGGPVTLEWEVARPSWINDDLSAPLGWVHWGDVPRVLSEQEWLIGANSCFKKETLVGCGGFDERLGRKGPCLLSGEETQIKKKIEASGGHLYYHPLVTVRHFVPAERVQPGWYYRRYFWGGVTDRLMRATVSRGERVSSGVATQGDSSLSAKLNRVLTNFINACGFVVSEEKTIQGRIYVAYVLGWCYGLIRWPIVGGCDEQTSQ